MEKISSLISKKVISLNEGELLGYVLDVVLDVKLQTYEGLIVVDGESENKFFLKRDYIISTGEDCVMIEDSQKLEFEISSKTNNPIGKEVYDGKGVFLGRVLDVEVSGKNVKKILTNKCEFPQKYIQKSGENYIIFGLLKNKKKNNIFESKKNINLDNLPKVIISSYENNSQLNQSAVKQDEIRVLANPNRLIGRVITNDLFGKNNEIIAKKNEKISKKTIKNAKIHNKLNFLIYYSREN